MTGGIAILLAGVIAGGSFGIVMKAQQDRPDRAVAARAADPGAAEAAAHGPVATVVVGAQPQAQPQLAPATNVPAPSMPGLSLAPIQAQDPRVAAAPVAPPARGGLVAPTRGRLAAGRGAPARGYVAPAAAPARPHVEPPPAASPRATKAEAAPATGGIRTVKIQAPASEPVAAPPAKETPAKEAPAKEAPAKEATPPKAGKRDTTSTDDLLEEAIKNTSNVL
jgi:hypothetical protein